MGYKSFTSEEEDLIVQEVIFLCLSFLSEKMFWFFNELAIFYELELAVFLIT